MDAIAPTITKRTGHTQSLGRTKRQPLVRSVGAIRAIVVALTLLSFGAMTAYAGTHLQNNGAPLTPAAATAAAASMAPTAVAQTNTGTLTLSSTVQTTAAPAVTTTHRS